MGQRDYQIAYRETTIGEQTHDIDFTIDEQVNAVIKVAYQAESHNPNIVQDGFFADKVLTEFGYRFLRGCCLSQKRKKDGQECFISLEPLFRRLIKPSKTIVEIGTWRGVSAAVLSQYCDTLITIDNKIRYEPLVLWHWAGVSDKIIYLVTPTNKLKTELLNNLDFDFAFIDGNHLYDEVKLDWQLTQKCGCVLFHDWYNRNSEHYEVNKLITEIDSAWDKTLIEPFALCQMTKEISLISTSTD